MIFALENIALPPCTCMVWISFDSRLLVLDHGRNCNYLGHLLLAVHGCLYPHLHLHLHLYQSLHAKANVSRRVNFEEIWSLQDVFRGFGDLPRIMLPILLLPYWEDNHPQVLFCPSRGTALPGRRIGHGRRNCLLHWRYTHCRWWQSSNWLHPIPLDCDDVRSGPFNTKVRHFSRRIVQNANVLNPFQVLPSDDVKEVQTLTRKLLLDTHCHLDFIFRKLGRDCEKMEKFLTELHGSRLNCYEGCIAVFCQPELWKKVRSIFT